MSNMSDTWNIQDPESRPQEGTEPVPAKEPAEQPAGGSPAGQGTAAGSQSPTQAPFNGWSSDGSYRYVPPRGQPSDAAGTGASETVQQPAGGQAAPTGSFNGQTGAVGGQTGRPAANGGQPTVGGAPQPNTVPPYQQPGYVYSPNPGSYGWNGNGGGPVYPAGGRYVPNNGGKPPRKKNNGWIVAIAIIGALGVIAAVVCLGLAAMSVTDQKPNASETTSSSEESGNTDAPSLKVQDWSDNDGGLSTREVVNRNLDSTVVLTIYSQSTKFTFGESTLTKAGAASGIIMSEDGYVITNRHCVVDENTGREYARVDVTTYDGKTYEGAEIIGADASTDLAVIKINATGLSPAQFGDSSQLAVGDRVIALGNAAGLSWTATQGIVSALARDVYDDTGYAIKCLQVDAAINPGNSGGPLLNNQGLVVGINSSKIAAEGCEGLGFSIPINEAKTIIDSLLQYGHVRGRVALGITGQTVSSGAYSGFMIASINSGSSLEGTEAAVGDLIVAVDDTQITSYGTLRSELAKHSVGDQVTLTLLRSNRQTGNVSSFTIRVTLKEETN